ncbi:hypothetical protein EUTSA_v10028853mg [Eutrema salsugineum]|uniref:MATH domain-containing protein n=1 Tax=Eutrema salsugineum TaxID=72664 RepID=V4L5U5_EUTSA|nr:uncharacterized protein LOC18014963 [Eutrema salsugineum]ESQ37677.1 hypothetical protein EUTSA_v10028853mg [Eutrema salsugineum]
MSRPIPIEQMVSSFKSYNRTTHLFKIDNFSLFKKHKIEMVESSVFDLGGHKWKLVVYPNGNKNGNGHVSIFLENQASIDVKIDFEVFVICQRRPFWHTSGKRSFGTSSIPQRVGTLSSISLADLEKKGYIIGDCCMFGAKLYGFEPGEPATAECFSLIEKPLNHKVTWMMTKFSSFDPEKFHQSNEFVVGNRKWRIEVHPRGFKWGKGKSFSVYILGRGFINNAPKTKTFAKFKLRVLDQVNRDHVERKGWGWLDTELGFADFMPLEKMVEPYLVKDKLYVGVEFEVISVTNCC